MRTSQERSTQRVLNRIGLILALLAFGLPSPAQAQTYTLSPAPFQTFLDNSGNIVNGGCVSTFLTGTTTREATYTTSSGTLNANPIIAGSDGRFVAFLQPGVQYRFRFENIPCSAATPGATIRTIDGIAAVPVSGLNVDVTGTAGETLSLADLVYLSGTDGSWYRADADVAASSITAVNIGFATAAAASAATVTVRTAGRMTGLSLTAGDVYYVSATAAALTATPPTNTRCVGKADSTTTLILPCGNDALGQFRPPQGRCTLTSATPVTTADVTAATTLYYALYKGNQITLYDGTERWVELSFAQLSIAVPATTATMYDVFVDYTAGVPALEAVAWTNDTTRATALALQNGVYVQTSDTDSLYVCSFRTTAVSGQTEDSERRRLVSNYYNRVRRTLRVNEATNSWTYTTGTWRQAGAVTTNQVEAVIGVAEDAIDLILGVASSNASASITRRVGIGRDSTTAPTTANYAGHLYGTSHDSGAGQRTIHQVNYNEIPPVGYHYWAWLEISTATGTTTWYGDDGDIATTSSGIIGTLWN